MNAPHIHAMLLEACRQLEDAGEHAIAAYVGHGMALIEEKYGVTQDRVDDACHH